MNQRIECPACRKTFTIHDNRIDPAGASAPELPEESAANPASGRSTRTLGTVLMIIALICMIWDFCCEFFRCPVLLCPGAWIVFGIVGIIVRKFGNETK